MAAKTTKSTTKRSSKAPPPPSPATETMPTIETRGPSTEEIQRRAFELFVARGRQHGRAQEDWLTAERELRERYSVS